MPFPQSFLDELMARSDIVDVVGSYVQLTRKGANLFGLCPFHSEKTGSFSVSPDKQIYYCFGCKRGGGVINFIMEEENLSFPDAVRFLAKRAGMEVPEEDGDREAGRRRQRLLDLNRDAARFYYQMLQQPEGRAVQEYLDRRKIRRATAVNFGLGASLDAWDALILAMTKKGYTKSELNEHMSEESIMIITGGNASVDFESWDKSIADENSNLHLVSYGPRGDTTRCFLVPLYYLTKNYARQDALKKYLDSYVEARSKLAKKPQLILADFMMRTGKDNHGDPAGQRVFTGPDGKERIYSPLVLNTKGPNDSRIGKMLDTSAHEYLDVGDNADQLWWVALDFKDECRPIYHMRFMKEDDARKHGFEPRGQDAESGMMWDAIDNHYVCLKFSPDDSHKEPVSGVGIARKGKSDDLYYVIATSPGTDMTLPYSIDEQFPAYWGSKEYKLKSENPPYRFGVDQENDLNEGDSWFGRNKATNHKQWIFPVYTTKALDWPIRFTKATD